MFLLLQDPCASNPCNQKNKQICEPNVGPKGYKCACSEGYTGEAYKCNCTEGFQGNGTNCEGTKYMSLDRGQDSNIDRVAKRLELETHRPIRGGN